LGAPARNEDTVIYRIFRKRSGHKIQVGMVHPSPTQAKAHRYDYRFVDTESGKSWLVADVPVAGGAFDFFEDSAGQIHVTYFDWSQTSLNTFKLGSSAEKVSIPLLGRVPDEILVQFLELLKNDSRGFRYWLTTDTQGKPKILTWILYAPLPAYPGLIIDVESNSIQGFRLKNMFAPHLFTREGRALMMRIDQNDDLMILDYLNGAKPVFRSRRPPGFGDHTDYILHQTPQGKIALARVATDGRIAVLDLETGNFSAFAVPHNREHDGSIFHYLPDGQRFLITEKEEGPDGSRALFITDTLSGTAKSMEVPHGLVPGERHLLKLQDGAVVVAVAMRTPDRADKSWHPMENVAFFDFNSGETHLIDLRNRDLNDLLDVAETSDRQIEGLFTRVPPFTSGQQKGAVRVQLYGVVPPN
jgi:hypothetical protein